MQAAELEKTMKTLGTAVILGMFLQVRIFDRNVLFPFFAVACVVQLEKLGSYRALGRSRRFTTARACGYLVVVTGFAAWLPGPVGGTAGALGGWAIFVGLWGYAGALRDWSLLQEWMEPAAKARSAMAWLVATVGLSVAALLIHLIVSDPGVPAPTSNYSPSSIFGRPLVGWGPSIAVTAIAMASIVGLLKLRATSQVIRHSLRAQPDALLAA